MVSAPTEGSEMAKMPVGFLVPMKVEPIGRWFLSFHHRMNSARGLSVGTDSLSESESEVSDDEHMFEEDIAYLKSLDPKDCKNQDHYKVLGLAKLRFQASNDQIKKAYRGMVLKHHPDKRKAAGEDVVDSEDYFACITKAFENLGTPARRRAFDSVDPLFDNAVPDAIKAGSTGRNFFAEFGQAFERNARWSVRRPVTRLGDEKADRASVDRFYKFWYDFESWREYSFLDEEDKEKGSDREERRWIEKNNRVQRAEKKKEEMKRIRRLVDNAYNSDPRIQRFKDEDKQEKLAKKAAKQEAARQKREAEEREQRMVEEREKLAREEKDRFERERREKEKNEKEAAKKALKRERKRLKGLGKDNSYFAADEDEHVANLTNLDRLCEILPARALAELNERLEASPADEVRSVFLKAVEDLNAEQEREKREAVEEANRGGSTTAEKSSSSRPWSNEELTLLIKAVNLFPAGTTNRWEVVASFLNQHDKSGSDSVRTAKETLSKAKSLQSSNFHTSTLRDDVNKNAYENLEKQQKKRDVKVDDAEASTRTESAAEAQGLNVAPWTPDEQKLLEQALKTYPASTGTERWDKIAGCVPSRSKKDCMKRYKELAELVRAKKAAQAAIKKS